jgi:CBS domain-containing protein
MIKASDIMSKDVVTISASSTVAKAVELMKQKRLRSLIVDRSDEYDAYGMVTETDVVYKITALGKDPTQAQVYEIMTKPCISVNPELSIEAVVRLFADNGIHRAPVVAGTLLGIISITDILRRSDFVESPKGFLFEGKIKKGIEQARIICAFHGDTSGECSGAWDQVEELQAEASLQKAERNISIRASFEEYCAANPNAPECRIFYED